MSSPAATAWKRKAECLIQRDVDGGLEVARLDQAPEARRARDVGALPDHDEPGVGADRERLKAAEPGPVR